MTKSSRKVVLVTGATGGIGEAVCRSLVNSGHMVIGQYNSQPEKARLLQDSLNVNGSDHCRMVRADLALSTEVVALVSDVRGILDQTPDLALWGIVNAAALLLGPSFERATPELFDHYFAVNTKAPFFITQGLYQSLIDQGSIVNISSANAHFSSPGDIVYSMSKTALESMTKNLAELLARSGIRINTVVPGFTDNGHPAFRNEASLAYMSSFSALGGVASAEQVADAVLFLLSREASRITGATLDVSGGSTLGLRANREDSIRDFLE